MDALDADRDVAHEQGNAESPKLITRLFLVPEWNRTSPAAA
jgi:hypothetical protein